MHTCTHTHTTLLCKHTYQLPQILCSCQMAFSVRMGPRPLPSKQAVPTSSSFSTASSHHLPTQARTASRRPAPTSWPSAPEWPCDHAEHRPTSGSCSVPTLVCSRQAWRLPSLDLLTPYLWCACSQHDQNSPSLSKPVEMEGGTQTAIPLGSPEPGYSSDEPVKGAGKRSQREGKPWFGTCLATNTHQQGTQSTDLY